MRNPLVAGRYAKALIQLAVEQNQLDEVKRDIEFLRQFRATDFGAMVASPIIRGEKKSKVFKVIFHGKVSMLTEMFFDLVFKKGREFVMRDIGDAFDEQYNEIKGIVRATLITAEPVPDELREDLYQRVSNLPRFKGKTIQLEMKTDPNIIGGMVLQAGDVKFDASIKHDLHFIKQEFIKNLYEMRY